MEVQQGRSRRDFGENGAFKESCEHLARDGSFVRLTHSKIITDVFTLIVSYAKLPKTIPYLFEISKVCSSTTLLWSGCHR
jgi:hypothetical protein